YTFALKQGLYVDATNSGSIARFANHSCEPNCKAEVWIAGRQPRIVLEATRAIDKEEPCCIDYEYFAVKESCHCGSRKCRWKEERPPIIRERLSSEAFDQLKRARTDD
ncbi:hypothetical protein EDB81DRAFT_659690, partial [Dactylonectria macrodidyma]